MNRAERRRKNREPEPVDIGKGAVRWVTLYDDEHLFGPNYVQSLMPMLAVDLGNEKRLARGGWTFKLSKGYDVAEARNEATKAFLESDVEWMWFIDADMGWEPDALERLMAVAHPTERPIVGGLCFGYTTSMEWIGEAHGPFKYPFPTIYDLVEEDEDIGFSIRWHYLPGALQKVGATGAAFLLIHRSVFEKLRVEHGDHWWSRIRHPKAKKPWGEDVSFCVRAGIAGFPIFVDTRVRTSHLKPIYVSESTYFERREAPPADEEIDVIVPVMGRPEHAERFMKSLRATTGLAHATALANPDEPDVAEAWLRAGADVLVQPEGRTTFSKKANDGYRATNRPWLLLVGSDVVFRPGWWDHALNAARLRGAGVVATNDLCNLDVRDGRLATHPVMRRSYIDEHGGSWDGPGVVAHEGYGHCFVDVEWSSAAIQRGMFCPAPGAIVEHLHPQSDKSEWDSVYALGESHLEADRRLFEERLKQHA